MNIETKKINDAKTCQDFASDLWNHVEMKGYLTPAIEQVLHYLNKNCPAFTEQIKSDLGKQAISLSQDRETPLQSLYVVNNLLRGFNFPPKDLEIIGENTLSLLKETYKGKISLSEYDVDTRLAGWAILDEIVVQVSSELKAAISQLSSVVGKSEKEDDFVQKQALQVFLKLASQQ